MGRSECWVRRYGLSIETQGGLHQAEHARSRSRLADVCFQRAKITAVLFSRSIGLAKGSDFDGVADGGPRRVRLDHPDITALHAGHGHRRANGPNLPLHAGCAELDLLRPVVADTAPYDDRIDAVAVALGVGEPFQRDRANAAARHHPGGFGVEGPRYAVARKPPRSPAQIADFLG